MKPFRPYRPKTIALVNWVGRLLAALGFRSRLDVDSLVEAAKKKAGLNDFGDESFLDAFTVLAESVDQEAKLHPFGRWVMRTRLIDQLVVRLQVEDWYRRYPEIEDISIQSPVVIAGLQRTGTTLLHRLLSADPNCRSLLSWEAINPAPPKDYVAGQKTCINTDPRIKAAKTAEKGLAYLAPEFFAIHPVDANAPEEDVLLMELAFISQVPEATLHVPSYARWRAQTSHRPAYEYLKRLLKLLQWQRPPANPSGHWVLKTPAHLEHLETLLEVFPGARIVQTHRDPQKTVGSFSSMLAHGYGVFSDDVDAVEIAQRWAKMNGEMTERAWAVRQANPESFVDVSYYDLLDDPMAQVKKVYEFAGLELTPEVIQEVEQSRRSNKKDRHGRHQYHLEDFGLDADKVEEIYGDYRARFDIPLEAARQGT